MNYMLCSMMLKGRIRKKIDLDRFYQKLSNHYSAEYNPEVTNRVVVHMEEASILFFASGTIQIYLKNPEKKTETIGEINKMLRLIDATPSPNF